MEGVLRRILIMSLFDPALLPAIPSTKATRTFTDPAAPGHEWAFTFEAQEGYPAAVFLSGTAAAFADKYVRGGEVVKVGDTTILISEMICENIAVLITLDRTGFEESPAVPNWNFAHWAAFAARCPRAFVDVLSWAYEMQTKAVNESEDADAESGSLSLKNV